MNARPAKQCLSPEWVINAGPFRPSGPTGYIANRRIMIAPTAKASVAAIDSAWVQSARVIVRRWASSGLSLDLDQRHEFGAARFSELRFALRRCRDHRPHDEPP
jgi:hypothetical protein